MYNFHKQIQSFLKEHVSLTADQQKDMANRRERNLKRIDDGLSELNKPSLVAKQSQGGYAMKTMVQSPENDTETRYDIDEGVIFSSDEVLTPRTTKRWVCEALKLKGKNFKTDPYIKPKCVRVEYVSGYQCDFPVFRRSFSGNSWKFELAAGDEWLESDPKAMNDWFEKQVSALSPSGDTSLQLRRIVKLGKYFSKVEAHRKKVSYPGGLVVTSLIVDCYVPVEGRDDESFYETLVRISQRSEYSPVYADGKQISDDKDIDRIKRLVGSAEAAKEALAPAFSEDAEDKSVRKAWKQVFRHSYFEEKEEAQKVSETAAYASAGPAFISRRSFEDRLEQKADQMRQDGLGQKPWGEPEL